MMQTFIQLMILFSISFSSTDNLSDDELMLEIKLNNDFERFLRKMDEYVYEHTSANNGELEAFMSDIFASSFYFEMIDEKGNELFAADDYSISEWVEAQNIDDIWYNIYGTLVCNSYHHQLTIDSSTQVTLNGYHDHKFYGDYKLYTMGSEQVHTAYDAIIWSYDTTENSWYITSYIEVVNIYSNINGLSSMVDGINYQRIGHFGIVSVLPISSYSISGSTVFIKDILDKTNNDNNKYNILIISVFSTCLFIIIFVLCYIINKMQSISQYTTYTKVVSTTIDTDL